MSTPPPVPLTSTIAAAVGLAFPFPAHPSAASPRVVSPEPTQPHAQDPDVETPEQGENIADAILNGAKPHRAHRVHPRHRHHWAPFALSISKPAVFEEDTVDDIYEIIERYGLNDTSAGRNFGVTSSTMSGWKEADPNFIEFLEIARAKFELDQVHKVESAVRKDGQADSQCARWLLERSLPERWGTPSARRAATQKSDTDPNKGPKPKPPKPGTPEFWDAVEEEPLPRKLAGCIMTPGRSKFYSTLHLIGMQYKPDVDPANPPPPPVSIHSEQGQAELEGLFRFQEKYFGLPKEQRLPYLHSLFERQYGKVLSPEERAKADALVGPRCPAPDPADPVVNPGAKTAQSDTRQQSKLTPNIPETHSPASVQPEVSNGVSEATETVAKTGEIDTRQQSKPAPNIPETSGTAEKNPGDYTHEENIAFFQEQARRQAEREARRSADFAAWFDEACRPQARR